MTLFLVILDTVFELVFPWSSIIFRFINEEVKKKKQFFGMARSWGLNIFRKITNNVYGAAGVFACLLLPFLDEWQLSLWTSFYFNFVKLFVHW